MHGRPNVEFWLHIHNVRETNVDALWKEKCLGKEIVGCRRGAPQVIETSTPFPIQLGIWSKAMDDQQDHRAGLNDTEPLKKRDCGSHGEGCENVDDQSHRMKSLQVGLKQLVLELSPKEWG
jgi:hypothetical protein